MKTIQHQKDLKGCGIACMANLLGKPYDSVKNDFEKNFYTIKKGVNIVDMVRYLERSGRNYKSKFFNQKKFSKTEADKFSKIEGSITLVAKSEKYPVGHYLLKAENGWVDPWYNHPSIDKVHAGIRQTLPANPWYVLYPVAELWRDK